MKPFVPNLPCPPWAPFRFRSRYVWWRGLDSNQRRRQPTDLQSVPFNPSGTPPILQDDKTPPSRSIWATRISHSCQWKISRPRPKQSTPPCCGHHSGPDVPLCFIPGICTQTGGERRISHEQTQELFQPTALFLCMVWTGGRGVDSWPSCSPGRAGQPWAALPTPAGYECHGWSRG